MAESGLSVGAPELRQEIGYFLGYGRGSIVSWSTAQLTEINIVLNAGIRRAYYPAAVDGSTVGYEWSFLRPFTTLSVVDGTSDYDLPDDFGRFIDVLHYAEEEYLSPVVIISASDILRRRSSIGQIGSPQFGATRWKSSTGTTGQRQELLLYPEPDEDKTMSYQYEAYSDALSDTYPYPLGGMKMSELYIESCLAIAEQRINDTPGVHTQAFGLLLIDAIARDRRQGAKNFGQMGNAETPGREFRRGDTGGTYSITYKGSPI